MFRRRNPLTRLSQLRSMIWPARGFRRLFTYLGQRILRTPGSTSSIAMSLSFGVAISFTPFLGFHLILAAVMTSLFRGNILVSAIGTFIGNPWTFPLIWYVDYEFGVVILRWLGFLVNHHSISLSQFSAHPTDLLLPLTLGGLVLGVISWFTTFGLTYWMIDLWRQHRTKRLMKSKLHSAEKMKAYAPDAGKPEPSASEQKTDTDF